MINICVTSYFVRGGISLGNSVSDSIGRIWLDDLRCKGTEETLAKCKRNVWGIHDCQHKEDVGIRCDNFVRAQDGNEKYDIENKLFWPQIGFLNLKIKS